MGDRIDTVLAADTRCSERLSNAAHNGHDWQSVCKTSSLLSIIGHRFDDGPRLPTLFVLPTQKLARSFATDRCGKPTISFNGSV